MKLFFKFAEICEICGLKRLFDLATASLLLCFLSVPILVVGLVVRLTSEGPELYWSDRVGINNSIFRMPKFPTMIVDTPAVATHLMKNPDVYVTRIGSFLIRRLPQYHLPELRGRRRLTQINETNFTKSKNRED